MDSLLAVMGGAMFLYAGLAAYLYLAQDRLVVVPGRQLSATPADAGLAYEPLTLTAEDGVRLTAWYVRAPGERGVVLYCHGNAGTIADRVDRLRMLAGLGQSVLIFDYRGYGTSQGTASEQGAYRDAEAAWRHLTVDRAIPAGCITVIGESLGGAVAARLASRHAPGCLALLSAFTSVPDMASRLYPFLPVRLLARIGFPTIDYVGRARCPVLVAHSDDDEVVPAAHGRSLFAVAPEPKSFLALAGGHAEGFPPAGGPALEGLDAFIRRHAGDLGGGKAGRAGS
jgi:fermentation-respiration switch protein FrsA (DUF1100 family)